jgi:flagella basal body P-ring formation protein FlgA
MRIKDKIASGSILAPLLSLVVSFFVPITFVFAGDSGSVGNLLTAILAPRFPGARIELNGPIRWSDPAKVAKILASEDVSVRITGESSSGEVQFEIYGAEGREAGTAGFSAYKKAWLAQRRIQPLEALKSQDFAISEVEVSRGQLKDLRGVILETNAVLEKLESRQTLLEGQPVLSTAVQLQAAVKRGSSIRVELITGDIVLSTQATALENGLAGKNLRIMTDRQKRELVGRLREDGVVEVAL